METGISQLYVQDINENVTGEHFPLSKKIPPARHPACPIPTWQALLTSPLLAPCRWHIGVCSMREQHKKVTVRLWSPRLATAGLGSLKAGISSETQTPEQPQRRRIRAAISATPIADAGVQNHTPYCSPEGEQALRAQPLPGLQMGPWRA